MRLSVVSATLAAAFVLAPVAAGHAPALSQDFSITNTVEPADGSRRDLIRQLQAWWDVHAYYPRRASQNDGGGTVKIHMVIYRDGNIGPIEVAESSGSRVIDTAGVSVFRLGYVRPLPAGAPDASLDIALHYVLTHRYDQPVAGGSTPVASKSPFTVTNDPVKPTVVDTVLQRTCTGTVVVGGLRNHPIYGSRNDTTVIFFRKPDGTPWVKFWEWGNVFAAQVTEVGKLVQWTGGAEPEFVHRRGQGGVWYAHYTVWPDADNHLIGDITYPGGTVDLTCATDQVPALNWNPLFEDHGERDWQIDAAGQSR